MAKNIGVIIEFDDIDYSDEERNLLWGRFALFLAEAAEEQRRIKNAKCIDFPNNASKAATKKVGFSTN